MSNKRKTFIFSETICDQVTNIQQSRGFKHEVDVVTLAISELYKNEFNYVKVAKDKLDLKKQKMAQSPEQTAENKIIEQEAFVTAKEKREAKKKADLVEAGREIAVTLRGEVYLDEKSGDEKCRYYSYGWLNTRNAWFNERVKYLDELTLEDADMQFYNDGTNPKSPMPADQVIATLVELGLTNEQGKPR